MTKNIPDEKLKEVTGGTEQPQDLNNTGQSGGGTEPVRVDDPSAGRKDK